jgi:hypothetical protein
MGDRDFDLVDLIDDAIEMTLWTDTTSSMRHGGEEACLASKL